MDAMKLKLIEQLQDMLMTLQDPGHEEKPQSPLEKPDGDAAIEVALSPDKDELKP